MPFSELPAYAAFQHRHARTGFEVVFTRHDGWRSVVEGALWSSIPALPSGSLESTQAQDGCPRRQTKTSSQPAQPTRFPGRDARLRDRLASARVLDVAVSRTDQRQSVIGRLALRARDKR